MIPPGHEPHRREGDGWWQGIGADGARHVMPVNDLRSHDQNHDCWCEPKIERLNGGQWLVTHNSADRREFKLES